MQKYSVFFIVLSLVATIYGEDCDPAACTTGDTNKFCDDTNTCRCKPPFVKVIGETLCQDTRQLLATELSSPMGTTVEVQRFKDCQYLLVLRSSEHESFAGKTSYIVWDCSLDQSLLPDKKDRDTPDDATRTAMSQNVCFGDDIRLSSKSHDWVQYAIKSEDLQCGAHTYYFRVHSYSRLIETMLDVTVIMSADFTADITIICEANCGTMVNPSKKLVFAATCENCKDDMKHKIRYDWMGAEDSFNLTAVRTPLDVDAVLLIDAYKLQHNTTYTFIVIATSADGSQAWTHARVSTRLGMTEGTCTIDPPHGFAPRTLHTLTCQGFRDPDGNFVSYALRNVHDGDNVGQLLSYANYGVVKDLKLPLGDRDDGWKLKLRMKICSLEEDSICTFAEVHNITVEPDPGLNASSMSKAMQDASTSTNAMETAQILLAVMKAQREIEKEANIPESTDTRRQRTQMREKVMATLTQMPSNSFGMIEQQTSVLSEITSERDHITKSILTNGSMVMANLTKSFIEQTSTGYRGEEIEATGKSLIKVVSTLITEFVESKPPSGENVKARKATLDHRDAVRGCLTNLNSVKEALVKRKVVGEKPTVVETEDLTMKIEKIQRTGLKGLKVQVESDNNGISSEIDLPEKFPLPRTDQSIAVEAVHFKTNPYVWSDSAKDVTSPVVQVQLKMTEEDIVNYVIKAENLTENVRIVIPQRPVNPEPMNVTLGNDVLHIVFNKTTNASKVMVFFDGSNGDLPAQDKLNVTIFAAGKQHVPLRNLKQLFNDTNATEIFSQIVDLGSGPIWLEPTVYIGSHFINLRFVDSSAMDANTNYTFQMFVAEIKCLYWEEDTEMWSHEGCYTGDESNETYLVCYCSHMTSFAGGFLVMPNKLDLEKVPSLQDLWNNPVGIAVVSATIFLYCIALIFAFRKDRRDFLRGAVVNLADNNPNYDFAYIVSIQTGSRRNAGTSANCCCVLIGTRGESDPHVLFNSSTPMCQRGSYDSFVVRTQHSLGPVTRIKLWHDNTGGSPEWFINTCRVIDVRGGELYIFICNFWLADCLGDKVIIKTFKIATESEQREMEYLFFTNATEAMQETHLWLSPYAHQPDSIFTTVQRVSCCLSVFMTYMLCNIMFYGIEPEAGGEQSMDLGPTTITWTELRIGFFTGFIMLPVNILLITIFTNVRPRYARKLYHVHLDTLNMHLALSAIRNDEFPDLSGGNEYSYSYSCDYGSLVSQSLSIYRDSQQVELEKVAVPLIHTSADVDPTELAKEHSFLERRKQERQTLKSQRCCTCMLPWWFVIINWIILFSIVIVCSYFTILYSFDYGLEVSMKWLSSLIIASMGDAFLNQPIKVLIIAILFSFVFKSTLSEPSEINVDTDPTIFKGFQTGGEAQRVRMDFKNVYIPPEQIPSRPDADLVKIQNDEKVHKLFFEIVRYIIFLYLTMLITYGRQDVNQYYLNAFISDQVIAEEDLHECGDLASIWEYISETLMEGLYDPVREEYVNGIDSLRLTPPILVQTRRPPCTEPQNWIQKKANIFGRHEKCLYRVDEDDYGPDWERGTKSKASVWRYNSSYQGYVAELYQTHEESMFQLEYLADTLWLDNYTTSLSASVILYNPVLNLMSHVEVIFNINNPIGVQTEKNLQSLKMYRSTREIDVFVVILEVVYVLYSCYFMFYVLKCIYRQRWGYFKNVWSFLDLFVVLVSLAVISIYTTHAFYADQAVEHYRDTRDPYEFVRVRQLHDAVTNILALLVTCAVLKFINMLRFNPIVFLFLEVLQRARGHLMWSFFMLTLLLAQFASIFHVISSGRIEMFRTVSSGMIELFISILGEYEVEYLQLIHPTYGPLVFLLFLIFSLFVCYNMMASILIDMLNTVKRETLPDDEAKLLALLIDRILQWFGIMRRKGGRLRRRTLGRVRRRRRQKKKKPDQEEIIKETTYV